MQDFYNDSKFIIAFLVLVLIMQAAVGEKFTEKFCLLVMFSMVILNADSFSKWFGKTFSLSEEEKK